MKEQLRALTLEALQLIQDRGEDAESYVHCIGVLDLQRIRQDFVLRNYMRKISGRRRRVPKREIVTKPPEPRLQQYARLLERALAAFAERLGL